jgi:hypothetical protein
MQGHAPSGASCCSSSKKVVAASVGTDFRWRARASTRACTSHSPQLSITSLPARTNELRGPINNISEEFLLRRFRGRRDSSKRKIARTLIVASALRAATLVLREPRRELAARPKSPCKACIPLNGYGESSKFRRWVRMAEQRIVKRQNLRESFPDSAAVATSRHLELAHVESGEDHR